MEFDVQFHRLTKATWIKPGLHRSLQALIGKKVKTMEGLTAIIVKVEYHITWGGLNLQDKKFLKERYGADVKKKYRQFTRVMLERPLPKQETFWETNPTLFDD